MKKGTKTQVGGTKDGMTTWRLRVWVSDPMHPKGGRQVSETVRIAVKGDNKGVNAADDALAAFVLRVRGNPPARGQETVTDLWRLWLRDDIERPGRLAPSTLRNYKYPMEATIIPHLGKIKLRDLTSQQLDAFYRKMQDDGRSASTVVKYHRILSSMFRQAERWGLMTVSPVRNARAPRATKPVTLTPGTGVVRELVQASTDDRLRLLILMAASLGARRGELCALQWGDIDLDKSVVTIKHSAYEPAGGGVRLKDTKTDRARVVSIDQQTTDALRAYKSSNHLLDSNYTFSDNGKTPWRPDHVTKMFSAVRKKVASAKGVRLHDLRHYHASALLAAGFDPVTVSKRLGHATVTTTMNIYASALDERDRAASTAIGLLLQGDGPRVDAIDAPVGPGDEPPTAVVGDE